MSMLWKILVRVLCVLAVLWLGDHARAQGFQVSVLSADVPYAWGVAVADFDGDGDFDAAATSKFSSAMWIETRETNTVAHGVFSSGGEMRGLAAGDFDGDGDADIILASYDERRFIFMENTGGSNESRFQQRSLLEGCNGAYAVRAGDFNGDGALDAVTVESLGNTVRFWKQQDGQLVQVDARNVPHNPFDVVLTDLDGDGDLDVVGSRNYDFLFWIEHGSSDTSWTVHSFDFGNYCTGVAVADLDGDGTRDIVGAPFTGSNFVWWQHTGNSYVEHVLSGAVSHPRSVQIADLDQDGQPDIVGCTQGGTMQWWHNSGNGNFALRTMPAGSQLYGMVVSDFDQDGDPDVIVADYSQSQLRFYRNTMGIPAVASGIVRAQAGGTPVGGVRMKFAGMGMSTLTDNAGRYYLASVPGTYSVQAEHACWNDAVISNVQIARGETTQVDISLTRPLIHVEVTSLNMIVHNGVVTEAQIPISNSGDGPLTIAASVHLTYGNDDWLSVAPSGMVIPAGGESALTVTIHPDTSNAGNWDYYGDIALHSNACPDSITNVAVLAYVLDAPERTSRMPERTALHAAYPNPFNARAMLNFDLASACDVQLLLYDITGRAVRTLSAGRMAAGQYRIPLNAETLPSGVYLLALQAGGERFSQKLLLIK